MLVFYLCKVIAEKTILICPLNWGLGHATRIVPIINRYQNQGYKVILAADGKALAFLKSEFPMLTIEKFRGVGIRYLPKPFFMLAIILQMPLFILQFAYERYRTCQMVKKYKPQIIISDNRYGIRSSKSESILITHQLFIQLPRALRLFNALVHGFTRILIERFTHCWVPDFENYETSMAGNLSHGKPIPKNVEYIGPLSRFDFSILSLRNNDNLEVLAIVSGPEPHRSMYQKGLEQDLQNTKGVALLVCGNPGSSSFETFELPKTGLHKINHASSIQLAEWMKSAEKIYARIGYSSLMDFHNLDKPIIWSATPGQPEQEYLLKWHNRNKA